MKARNPNLSRKDWELCCAYIEEMERKGVGAHEPWELDLVRWAVDANRHPRASTVAKLRIRFPDRDLPASLPPILP